MSVNSMSHDHTVILFVTIPFPTHPFLSDYLDSSSSSSVVSLDTLSVKLILGSQSDITLFLCLFSPSELSCTVD